MSKDPPWESGEQGLNSVICADLSFCQLAQRGGMETDWNEGEVCVCGGGGGGQR